MKCPSCQHNISRRVIRKALILFDNADFIEAEIECLNCDAWLVLNWELTEIREEG